MTKCDFCTMSDSKGKCFYYSKRAAESDCKKAINRMMQVYAIDKNKGKGKK